MPNLSHAIGSTVARQVLSGALHFIALWIIARQLGADKNGILATAMLLPLALHAFLNLGLGAGHAYYVSRGSGDYRKMRAVNWTLAAGLWLTVTSVLALAGEETIGNFLPGVGKDLALLGTALVPLMLLATWSSSMIQGSRDYGQYNKLLLVHPFMFCAAILLLFTFGAVSVVAVLWSYALSYLTFWLLSEWRIGKLMPGESTVKSSGLDSVRFGLKAHLSNVITFFNYRIDLYLVSVFADTTATGQYSLSIELAERLWLISYAASVVIFPEAAARTARPAELRNMTARVARAVFRITLIGAIVAALLAPFAIPWLFGDDYRGAIMPFLITLPGIVVWSTMRILSNTLAGLGLMRVNNWAACFCLVVNVVANLIAIPKYGATGAALATTIAYSVAAAYTAFMYRREIEKKIDAVRTEVASA